MNINALKLGQTRLSELGFYLLLGFLVYLLTPRGWEQGGESWTAWAAARMLADTGGFPVFSRNVLYVAWLTPFLKLPFPLSIDLEYCITHLFALASLFALIRIPLGPIKSYILIAALAPSLAVVEGGGTVAAIGFFSLYLRHYLKNESGTWPFLPASLLAAALCHSAYGPFVVLHLLVSALYLGGRWPQGARTHINFGRGPEKVALLLLVGFALIAFLLQSTRPDNNHMLMDPKFAPIPLTSAINIGFFQITTWNLVTNLYDPSVLAAKDWYFETPRIFGNSRTILDVLINDPHLFFSIVSRQMTYPVMAPLYFYSFLPVFGYTNVTSVSVIILLSVSMLLFLLLMNGLIRIHRVHGIASSFVLAVGTGGLAVAFVLTNFGLRYVITMLPVFLLTYAIYLKDAGGTTKLPFYHDHRFKTVLFFLGCALVFSNAPFRANNDAIGIACPSETSQSWFNQKAFRFACQTAQRSLAGLEYQLKAVTHNQGFLNSNGSLSPKAAHAELSRLVVKTTRILSQESTFFAGFTAVTLDNNRQLFSLAPYPDEAGNTGRWLDEIDVFFISEDLARDVASMSTQTHLRYKLHIQPYLNANGTKFNRVSLPRYGEAYIRNQ